MIALAHRLRTAGGHILEDDAAFTLALLEEQHVAAVHGAAYGMSPFVRISYATDSETSLGAWGTSWGAAARPPDKQRYLLNPSAAHHVPAPLP